MQRTCNKTTVTKKIETPVRMKRKKKGEGTFGRDSAGSSAHHKSASHQHAGFYVTNGAETKPKRICAWDKSQPLRSVDGAESVPNWCFDFFFAHCYYMQKNVLKH